MDFLRRLQTVRTLYRTFELQESTFLLGSSRSYSNSVLNVPRYDRWSISSYLYKGQNALPWTHGSTMTVHSTMASKSLIYWNDKRLATTATKAPAQGQQMVGLKASMLSPGFIFEPYAPREAMPFWRRWFTKDGWRRTKKDVILELKSFYAITKLKKTGYTKQKFYEEAVAMYKEINTLLVNDDKTSLRKAVTENMYSELKNEIKLRESMWSKVHWELIEPIVKIRTLRARLIGVDRKDLEKVFIQLTVEFLSKQKFEAYDSKGAVVAGDKTKEVLVRDIWVLEKSLFHPGAYWRLCGRINV
ncbi:uncharacterized protein LOC123209736 [Mangifera indica]|uniref:uncharacterized protein LOC123209736 n=1 Tax=Mangifera indica TaxID=29780 RepID=UPI001CFB608C|nr:uncharacterized protein LOC123209736 [Mangifera indica]XP_044483803.1 uncharacterized protein LOC123209736 [Mangifera indica]XP_044483804.1 uncharacterized protein LOC123209736 [Mangifera indica]XP_044483805.1 uncharacterized protein LOC123209736 [Mangifera indica]XP_044483806.1 uncharacterized protein LOC123209736 [Mangifera indica]XP_044483807.1 uncharacterized protein LOC123209736 [Mangifera indica]